MCLFFLLQYFPAVIAVQISQHTLITLMAISWELVLKYQAKFIPSITDESSPCTPKQINSPAAKSPLPSLWQTQRCQRGPTPDSDTGYRICPERHVVPDEPSEGQDSNVEDGSGST